MDWKQFADKDWLYHQKKLLDINWIQKQLLWRWRIFLFIFGLITVVDGAYIIAIFVTVKERAWLFALPGVLCWLVCGLAFLVKFWQAWKFPGYVKKGLFRFDEDIIVKKYTVRNDDSTFYRIVGAKFGKDLPNVQDPGYWEDVKIGDVYWLLDISNGQRSVLRYVYCHSFYELSSSLYYKVNFVSEQDVEDAKQVVRWMVENGEYADIAEDDVMEDFWLAISDVVMEQQPRRK